MRVFLITLLCLAIFGTIAVSIFGIGNAYSWLSGSGSGNVDPRLFGMEVGNGDPGLFGMGVGHVEPTLFGIGLGQVIPQDATDGTSHYTPCANDMYRGSENIDIPSQWECYMFSPESEYRDSQFVNHRVYVDRTNRQVVAVLAHSLPINSRASISLVRFKDLLKHAFSRYGQCEARLSQDCWDSGDIYRTTFFPSPDAGLVISYHTQFGVEACLYRISAATDNKGRLILPGGLILPERYPEPSVLTNGHHFKDYMAPHPATELYEKYRLRRRSMIGILEKHFGISAAKLNDRRISQPVWKNIVLNKETEKFHQVVMNGKDSTWEIDVSLHDSKAMLYSMVILCRLRLFDTPSQAYAYGMEQLTSRLLPAEAMCDIFRRAEDVSDICFEIPAFANSFNSHPRVILMRANGVLECEFLGQSDDLAADAAWVLDFFEKKSGTNHVDGAGESISLRR